MSRKNSCIGTGRVLLALAAAGVGCGDSGSREPTGGLSGTPETSVGPTAPTSTDPTPTTTSPGGTGTGTGTETGDSDDSGPPPATESDSEDGPKFDLPQPDAGDKCGGTGGEVSFSYIWVANSAQGTISKINTQTMLEEGRYLVRPDGLGSPSRTSVNLSGDVVVANRSGGITKVYARPESCVDSNGVPGIQTSTGAADILAWGTDECVAWYTAMPYNAQRPMAWTLGTFNEETCKYEDQKAWTTGGVVGQPGSVVALRLNGDTGAIEQTIPVPEAGTPGAGPYGGAVDGLDNFWFHTRDVAPSILVKVDAVTLAYTVYPVPQPVAPYGITVDTKNRVWLAGYAGGTGRFDPTTETWQVAPQTGLGIQEDAKGRMWIAHYPWDTIRGVHCLDVETMAEIKFIDMTAATTDSRGISVDFEGNVWMVDQTANAFRIEPEAGTWQVYTGLTGPYTYSDMTGFGLRNVSPGG
jgi:streptogramin lyase